MFIYLNGFLIYQLMSIAFHPARMYHCFPYSVCQVFSYISQPVNEDTFATFGQVYLISSQQLKGSVIIKAKPLLLFRPSTLTAVNPQDQSTPSVLSLPSIIQEKTLWTSSLRAFCPHSWSHAVTLDIFSRTPWQGGPPGQLSSLVTMRKISKG